MSDSTTMSPLAEQTFFRGLPAAHLDLLASGARSFSAVAGVYLARENQSADDFFLIRTGRVALDIPAPKRGPVTVQTVGPHEVIGWSWQVPPHRWNFDCRVVENVTGLAWNAVWLREQCSRDHELGIFILQRLLKVIAARLSATRLQLLDIYR